MNNLRIRDKFSDEFTKVANFPRVLPEYEMEYMQEMCYRSENNFQVEPYIKQRKEKEGFSI